MTKKEPKSTKKLEKVTNKASPKKQNKQTVIVSLTPTKAASTT